MKIEKSTMDEQKLNTRGDVGNAYIYINRSRKAKIQNSSSTRSERVEELKMNLPATLRNMIESHKHQIVDFNPTGAHEPRGVPILFHWTVMLFLNSSRETAIVFT